MSQLIYKFLTVKSEKPSVAQTDTSSGSVYEIKSLKISHSIVASTTEPDTLTTSLLRLNKKLFSEYQPSGPQTSDKVTSLSKE